MADAPLTRQGVRNLDAGRNGRRRSKAEDRANCRHNWRAVGTLADCYEGDGIDGWFYIGEPQACFFCGATRRVR